mmetsp:Transcript_10779/g.17660  ORF Transcript_10779/g.17660 Transcript_10779/m.17660 type:complete len:411 (+) Transcript_10779:145-1377(+)
MKQSKLDGFFSVPPKAPSTRPAQPLNDVPASGNGKRPRGSDGSRSDSSKVMKGHATFTLGGRFTVARDDVEGDLVVPVDPEKVVCWNVNGIRNRLKHKSESISTFMETHKPDVLFLSEVRMKAASSMRRGAFSREDKLGQEECTLLKNALKSGCFKGYTWCKMSLSSKRYSGTAILVRSADLRPMKVWYNLPNVDSMDSDNPLHHDDGRIILAEWKSFLTLHTYTPNNGRTIESFKRRREWDERLTQWLGAMASNLDRKPVVYMGDLNVAPTDRDLSHPAFFKSQFKNPASGDPGDAGQPGCSPNEQKRFFKMLDAGNLVDAFREVELSGLVKRSDDIYGPIFSWRGHAGTASPEAGKYFRRGMRIDHVLVSKQLIGRVRRVDILATGQASNDPSFMGSDHSPMLLEIGA